MGTTPSIWIGMECTRSRVRGTYLDQCALSGHFGREGDLPAFAKLGAERIRYPFLWEWVAPEAPGRRDWARTDEAASRLRGLGLVPIAGFVHHGSGPRYTDLLDPRFPELLADFAGAFARRYPWITDYTPVNEPLTTARFSGLYGIWYPHARDDRSFGRALYHQARATALAMREIRRIVPRARLVQTEDLGRAASTAPLRYQADFENERRWLTFDLLSGRVGPAHPLFDFLQRRCGISVRELEALCEDACPPDVVGLNHYPLSNRFLDHRLGRHAPERWGGNQRDRYADVGAVDDPEAELPDPKEVYREAWERYGLPIAASETHVRGHRETQVRWLQKIWRSAVELGGEGVDFRAVTLWSLLGSFGWDRLCSGDSAFYEPGGFDLRAPVPRPTAVAKLAARLALDPAASHPVAADPIVWPRRARPAGRLRGRPILVTGARGTLARAFTRICAARGLACCALAREELDITNAASVRAAIGALRPWAVVNAAAYVKVDEAEADRERCFRENVTGAELVAAACRERGLPLVAFSSDMVFGGDRSEPYLESHPVAPVNVYGRSKAEGEQRVLAAHPGALVVRTSSFFGPWDGANFVTLLLRELGQGRSFRVASDLTMSPTYVPDLVHHALDLLIDGETGILHLANDGPATWASFAAAVVERARDRRFAACDELVERRPWEELRLPARRPRYSALATERVRLMPPWQEALERYFAELEEPLITAALAGGGNR